MDRNQFDFTYHDTKMSDRINMRWRPKTGTKLSPLGMMRKMFKYHLISVKIAIMKISC